MPLGTFSSSNYLTRAATLPAYPFSVSAWVYVTNIATNQTIWGSYVAASTTNSAELRMNASGQAAVLMRSTPANVSVNSSPTAFTNNAWNFVAGSFVSATEARVHVKGTTSSGTSVLCTFDRTLCDREGVGIRADSTLPTFPLLSGRIAELAIYSGDLLANVPGADVASGSKVTPLNWQGVRVLSYWPFYLDPRNFLTGVNPWTTTGTLTAQSSLPQIAMPQYGAASASDGYTPSESPTIPPLWGLSPLGMAGWGSGGLGAVQTPSLGV